MKKKHLQRSIFNTVIYLDNNATTRLSKRVQDYVQNSLTSAFANASSEHILGQNQKQIIEDDRKYIAEYLNVSQKNIYFTSGATESINSILNPLFFQDQAISTVITSPLEHKAVISCVERLKKYNIKILHIKNDSNGILSLDHLKATVKANPQSLVTILGVNNETGVYQDIKQITDICKEYACLIHLDAVQMLGKVQIDLLDLDVDYASFSAHKIGGLKGIGVIYIKNPDQFTPFMVGGGQEQNIRNGTYNVHGIKSLRLALEDTKQWNIVKMQELKDIFEAQVQKLHSEIRINCKDANRVCNTSNVFFPNIPGPALLLKLSSEDIFISQGSACSPGSTQPSHVIYSLGFSKDYASSCVRFSFAYENTLKEINQTIKVLSNLYK